MIEALPVGGTSDGSVPPGTEYLYKDNHVAFSISDV